MAPFCSNTLKQNWKVLSFMMIIVRLLNNFVHTCCAKCLCLDCSCICSHYLMKYCIQCPNLPFRLSFSKLCEPLVSKQRCMRYLFLYYHTHCTNHSKSAMLKLISLHLSKFGSISGLETKRIKPNVTRVVVIVKL